MSLRSVRLYLFWLKRAKHCVEDCSYFFLLRTASSSCLAADPFAWIWKISRIKHASSIWAYEENNHIFPSLRFSSWQQIEMWSPQRSLALTEVWTEYFRGPECKLGLKGDAWQTRVTWSKTLYIFGAARLVGTDWGNVRWTTHVLSVQESCTTVN